jgi:hypothetical protein
MFTENHFVSEETRQKISKALKGKKRSAEANKKSGDANRGKCSEAKWIHIQALALKHTGMPHPMPPHNTPEHNKKISEGIKRAWRNKIMSPEEHARRRIVKLGENNPSFGKHPSEETRKKLCEAQSLERNAAWQGGKSFEVYPRIFKNKLLREKIKKSSNYKCVLCSGEGIDIHHIDYNKRNCSESNLILLCKSCHRRTGHHRQRWHDIFWEKQDLFSDIIEEDEKGIIYQYQVFIRKKIK